MDRRQFLAQLLGLTGAALTGGHTLGGEDPAGASPLVTGPGFRFAFVTDLHLLPGDEKRSDQGIAACLQAVERLTPRPEFILVGGDLVDGTRGMEVTQAASEFDRFCQIWKDNTSLPAYWTFGNHDLAGTYNPAVSPKEPGYGKGLFRQKFNLPKLFYSFDHGGWHFVVLDDIESLPGQTYRGWVAEEELSFLAQDLEAHREVPTVLCLHMPLWTDMLISFDTHFRNICCSNHEAIEQLFPRHNIRLVLSGHLHHLESRESNGIQFVNCGAVCANYWKGPLFSCSEGFGVVDLSPNGSSSFVYHNYGWKA